MTCDTVYGCFSLRGAGLAEDERIKLQYQEDSYDTWDVIDILPMSEDSTTDYIIAMPNHVTKVRLTGADIKKRIKKVVTRHRKYSKDEYRYCRLDEGWNGIMRGVVYTCGESFISQLKK